MMTLLQKGSSLVIFSAIMILMVSSASALECYQMNQQMTMQNQWYSCPSTVSQCFKFVCSGPTYYITKGCFDMTNPLTNCQTLQGQCQGQGGTGTCYMCNGNKCNGASGASFSIGALLIAVIAGLKTLA